jgi:hypothetical protein
MTTGPASLRQFASMAVVLGCFGLIVAAHFGVGMTGSRILAHGGEATGDAVGEATDETTGSLGHIGAGRAAPELSDEDRFRIYEGVMRMPDAPEADASGPDEAETLADDIEMRDLPLSVVRRLPQVEGYKFAKFDDRIVVINPSSRLVVAMIPRYKLMP